MKSIKLLLAAFALSATFAACTKEEVPVVQEIQQDQFVGAELIGTNVSMNIGADTKVDASGKFENGDKTGLGWIVKDGYGVPQVATKPADKPQLFANHMYIRENGKFVSKGNMYKGWHFAYFPFQYMEMLGEDLKVTINPVQTEDYTRDVVNTAFNISGVNFLSAESLDENYQIKDGIVFDLVRAVNTILVTVKPTDMFTGSEALKNLKIKSITLNTKANVFPNPVVSVNPTALPNVADEDFAVAEVVECLSSVMGMGNAKKSITANIDNDNINLTKDQTLRIYTLPAETADMVVAKNVSFVIEVEGGVFTVPYVTDEEADNYSEKNNEAIEALVEAYEEDGKLTEFGTKALQLELELNGAMFAPAFGAISSESEWNKAIAVADALGIDKPVFTLVNDVDEDGNYEWEFTDDIKLLAKTAADTKNKVNVTVNGNIVLGTEMTWPAKGLNVANANVVVNSDLRVENTLAPKSLVNNAVITVGPNGTVKKLDNTDAEVIAEYGAYVYPVAGANGTIAYVVDDVTTGGIHKVNTMLDNAADDDMKTSINTLIVKTVLDLNALAVPNVSGDRYEVGKTPKAVLNDLTSLNIILENGSLVHKLTGSHTTVKHVVAREGENTIDDVVVAEDIHTAEGAVLNVNNTTAVASKPYSTGAIYNEGTLNSNVAFLLVDDVDNSKGSINVANGGYVLYKDTYTQGGSVKGWVLKKAADTDAKESDLEYNDATKTYTVNSALGLVKLQAEIAKLPQSIASPITVVLGKNIDMSGIYWTGLNYTGAVDTGLPCIFDGNDKTISNLSGNSGLFNNNFSFTVKDLTIDGATIYGESKYAGAVAGHQYGTLTNVVVKNVEVDGCVADGSYGAIVGLLSAGGAVDCEVTDAIAKGGKRAAGIAANVNENDQEFKNCVVTNGNFTTSKSSYKEVGAIVGGFNGETLTFVLNKCKAVSTNPAALYGVNNAKKVTVK